MLGNFLECLVPRGELYDLVEAFLQISTQMTPTLLSGLEIMVGFGVGLGSGSGVGARDRVIGWGGGGSSM